MRDDPSVVALVARAARSDQDAWNEMVERYAPLVWGICARYRLSSQDLEDVGQNVAAAGRAAREAARAGGVARLAGHDHPP